MRKFVFAAAASAGLLALGPGATAAGASVSARPDATTQCGRTCTDVHAWGNEYDTGMKVILAARAPEATLAGAPSGTPVISRIASTGAWREDFTVQAVGKVNRLVRAGLLPEGTYVDLNYGTSPAGQLEYTPDGRTTSECLGTEGDATDGAKVVLEPCGHADTFWVADSRGPVTADGPGFHAVLPATGQNASNPLALQAPSAVGGELKVRHEAVVSGGSPKDARAAVSASIRAGLDGGSPGGHLAAADGFYDTAGPGPMP